MAADEVNPLITGNEINWTINPTRRKANPTEGKYFKFYTFKMEAVLDVPSESL